MNLFSRLCRSAAACLLSALALAPAALVAQQTIRVPADYTTIQAAINAAGTGDTVLVSPGTYFENLTLDHKEITLRSTAGAATTLLDGGHHGPILQMTDTAGLLTTIGGFTFQNGGTSNIGNSGNNPASGTAGIYALRSGLSVTNSVFRQNSGANLNITNGTLRLSNSSIATAPAAGNACANAGPNVPGADMPATGVILTGDSAITALGSPAPSSLVGNTISGDGTSCSASAVELQSLSVAPLLQNNVLRGNLSGVSASFAPVHLLQNLIYDNIAGALSIDGPRSSSPSTDPATTLITNNTIVNNHNPQYVFSQFVTEINISNVAAQVALRNNIFIGTTPYALLSCQSYRGSNPNDTPLLLDHNDLFNTSGGDLLTGNCFPNLASPLTSNGNLSVDPRLTSSADLHPLSGSPALDAGFNLLDDPVIDLDGNPRLADATAKGYPTVDLGAYERPSGTSPTLPTALELQPSAFVVGPGTLTLTASAHTLSASGPAALPTGVVTLLLNGAPISGTGTGTGTPDSNLDTNGNAAVSVSLTTPGVYALSATLAPSLGLAPAMSPVLYVLVTDALPATTTLTLAASPTTTTLNQPITLTVHLGSTTGSGASAQPGPIPPGAVPLYEGGTLLSNLQPDSSGFATFTIPHPAVGGHTYTASYAGTSTFSPATATTAATITQPVATSTTATISPNPAALGATITLTATVSASTGTAPPTGTVTFTDGATSLGSPALANGIASVTSTTLRLGLHTITITYTPDAGFSPSTTTTTVNVGGSATALSLSSTHSPATVGDLVSFTASVVYTAPGAAAAPSGSVTLTDDNTLIASAPLTPNSAHTASLATLTVPFTRAGPHSLTATFVPATLADVASSGTMTQTVTTAPTATVVLTIAPNPASTIQALHFTARITANGSGPTALTFFDGATALPPAVPLNPAALDTTINSFTRPGALSGGSHTLTAVVTDAAGEIIGTSNTVFETITAQPTTLVLTASPSPSAIAGAPVTLTATLTDAIAGSPAPVGTITFFDGSTVLGTAALTPDGRAVLPPITLAPGLHTVSATYSGDTIYSAAAAPPITEIISSNATSTSISVLPATSTAFAPVTLTARVTSSTSTARINTPACNPGCTPVTVTFFADTATGRSVLGIAALDATGGATLTITPTAGTYSLSAVFSGSPLFAASASVSTSLSVVPAVSALTLTANPNPVYQHQPIHFVAALVAAGVPSSALTGSITFLEGSNPIGTSAFAAAGTFSWIPPTAGAHTVTAIFAGDANLIPASATVTVNVLPSDFTLTVKDPSLTIQAEHHAPTTIEISTTGALSDTITLSCADLPQYATCTFSPASINLAASNHNTGTLMLDTDALLYYAGASQPTQPRSPSSSGLFTAVLALCLPPSLFAILLRLRRRRSGKSSPTPLPHLLATLLLSIAAATLSGCSGHIPSHVAPGTYAIHIVGHAQGSNVDHTATLTLIVTP